MKAPWLPLPFIHHPHPTFTPPSLNHHPLLSFSTFLTLPSPPSLSCQLNFAVSPWISSLSSTILQSHPVSQPTNWKRQIYHVKANQYQDSTWERGIKWLVLGILTVVSFPKLFIRHASLATASWGFSLHYYQGFCQHQAVNIIKYLFLMDSAG